MDASYNEMDVNMFNQYMYKSDDQHLNASLSVQGQHQQQQQHQQLQQFNSGQQQSITNQYHSATMSDHTFHTPSFGDEEFDIPVDIHHASQPQMDQYQMHGQISGMINNQQGYGQHQWTPQATAAESHMMSANQTFHNLQSPTNHSTFHHMSSPNPQMLMMQPPQQTHQQAAQPNQHQQQQQIQPQISPQMSGSNNYIGQSSPQTAPINSHENGSTSDDSDDNAVNDPNNAFKSQSKEPDAVKGGAKKTAKAPAKKKKKDPNEPLKPVSAYALFFRDTQAAIKGQNPNASFGEVSKIVASMWDVLAPEHKNVYKKKQEAAKKDYLKAIAAYRAGNLQQVTEESSTVTGSQQQNPIVPQQQTIQNTQTVQNFPSQTMTQSYQQPQNYVNQQTVMNQNVMQQAQNNVMMNIPNQQTQQIIVSQQQQQINQPQNQYMNNLQIQQITSTQPNFQQQQQPLQMINNNANQMPPVQMQQQSQPQLQNCIRNGCTNRAIVSVDWEDEYCSNECVILHCRDVFGNWIHNNSNNQQQNFSVVK